MNLKSTQRLFPLYFARTFFPKTRNATNLSVLRRQPSMIFSRGHCDSVLSPDAKPITVTFVDSRTGTETVCTGREGENLVHLAHANDVRLEGACECSLACSTCHVILTEEAFEAIQEPPCEDEEDLLDLAFGLTATSRLGCQVKLDKSIDGTRVTLPSATRNFYVDGHTPKPH
jgi:ferredoxin